MIRSPYAGRRWQLPGWCPARCLVSGCLVSASLGSSLSGRHPPDARGSGWPAAPWRKDVRRIIRRGAGGRFQCAAQGDQALGCLALHRSGRAAEDLGRLLDGQVGVVAKHQRGPLPRRHPRKGVAKVDDSVVICGPAGAVGQPAGQADPSHPSGTLLAEVNADQDGAGIGIGVLDGPGPAPVHVKAGDGGLHQIVGAAPVLAEQERDPAQPRQPGPDVLSELQRHGPRSSASPHPSNARGGLRGCPQSRNFHGFLKRMTRRSPAPPDVSLIAACLSGRDSADQARREASRGRAGRLGRFLAVSPPSRTTSCAADGLVRRA